MKHIWKTTTGYFSYNNVVLKGAGNINKKMYFIFGAVSIIMCSIIYTFERFFAYYIWIGQMSAHTGSFPTYPTLPGIFTNIFVFIFLVAGVICFALAMKNNEKVERSGEPKWSIYYF